MMMFGWSKSESVLLMSIALGIVGLIFFAVYVSFISCNLAKRSVSDSAILGFRIHFRCTLMASLVLLALFHLLTYSWPFLPGDAALPCKFIVRVNFKRFRSKKRHE